MSESKHTETQHDHDSIADGLGIQVGGDANAVRDCDFSGSLIKAAFSKDSWWISLALIAAIAIIYAQVYHFTFINYDDLEYVPNNPKMDGAINWQGVRWAFTTGYFSNWLPLTWISHMLDVQFFGFRAGAHHLTNVVIHAINSILLFGLLRVITGSKWKSAFVAAVFAVHPIHVESVAWIAERKDVLSTLFLFLTFGAYARYVRRPNTMRYVAFALLFALGLMSKPMLVTAPFALLLLDIWPFRRIQLNKSQEPVAFPHSATTATWLSLIVEKLPLIGMSVACSVATLMIQRSAGAVISSSIFPVSHRIKNVFLSYCTYMRQTIWPAKLALFYPHHAIPLWIALSCLAVLCIITLITILTIRNSPYLFVGWFWFLGLLTPVIGLIQAGEQARADRYMYVPMIGLLIMATWGLPELRIQWTHYRLALSTVAVSITILCVPISMAQASYWRDSLTIWKRSLAVTTENHVAHGNLGSALTNRGQFEEAIVHLREALRINPIFAQAHAALAICLSKTGHEQEALYHFEETRRLKPDLVDYYVWMGLILAKKGRNEEAVGYLKVAVKMKPDSAETRNMLGVALASTGKMDEAVDQFREAVRIRPHLAEAQNSLGVALASQGKAVEAISHFAEALRIKPEALDWRVNLARALNDSGKHAEAMQEIAEALRLDPSNADAQFALNQIRGGTE